MDIQKEIIDIENESLLSPSQIPFSLLLKPELKTSQLWIDNPNQEELKGSAKRYEFQFKSPILVTDVAIQTNGYSSHDEFEVSWITLNGSSIVQTAAPREDIINFRPNELITSFSFRPPSKFFPGRRIISVAAEGLDYESLTETLRSYQRISAWKQTILATVKKHKEEFSERSNEINAVNQRIENNKLALKESENALRISQQEVAKSEAQQDQARKDLETRQEILTKSEEDFQFVRRQTAAEHEKLKDLTKTVLENQVELKKLKDDINLFPTELSAFASQGSKTATLYSYLSLIPMTVIIVMTYNLIIGAGTLRDVTWDKSASEIAAVIIARSPYVALCMAVIAACYGLARFLLGEVVKINRQKLSLNKISIIATDVSKAAEIDLHELDQEELFEKRIQVKMILLREHLKTYIADDLDFKLPRIKFLQRIFPGSDQEETTTTNS